MGQLDAHVALEDGGQIDVGDHLVDGRFLAEQLAHHEHLVGGHAEQPGEGREHEAEDVFEAQALEAPVGRGHDQLVEAGPVAHPAEDAVEQRDERDEDQQHGADVDGQPHAIGGTHRDGVEHVGPQPLLGDLGRAVDGFHVGFRIEDFGGHDGRRSGDDGCREEVDGVLVAQQRHEQRKHASGDGGHAAHHQAEDLRFGHALQIGANDEGRFGLSDENVGRGCQTLGARQRHEAAQQPGKGLDDFLQDAEVEKDGREGREEYHGGQHPKREDIADLVCDQRGRGAGRVVHRLDPGLVGPLAKYEGRPAVGIAQQGDEAVGHPLEERGDESDVQDAHCQQELQQHTTTHEFPVDGFSVGTEQVTDAQQHHHAKHSPKHTVCDFHPGFCFV